MSITIDESRLDPGQRAMLEMMRDTRTEITRENYFDLAWGAERPEPWTPEHEAELPEELQDWTQFEMVGSRMVAKKKRR